MKRRCLLCEDDEVHHGALPSLLTWWRDMKILRAVKTSAFRRKHRRFSRFLCFFGRHESWVIGATEGEEYKLFRCSSCLKYNKDLARSCGETDE